MYCTRQMLQHHGVSRITFDGLHGCGCGCGCGCVNGCDIKIQMAVVVQCGIIVEKVKYLSKSV